MARRRDRLRVRMRGQARSRQLTRVGHDARWVLLALLLVTAAARAWDARRLVPAIAPAVIATALIGLALVSDDVVRLAAAERRARRLARRSLRNCAAARRRRAASRTAADGPRCGSGRRRRRRPRRARIRPFGRRPGCVDRVAGPLSRIRPGREHRGAALRARASGGSRPGGARRGTTRKRIVLGWSRRCFAGSIVASGLARRPLRGWRRRARRSLSACGRTPRRAALAGAVVVATVGDRPRDPERPEGGGARSRRRSHGATGPAASARVPERGSRLSAERRRRRTAARRRPARDHARLLRRQWPCRGMDGLLPSDPAASAARLRLRHRERRSSSTATTTSSAARPRTRTSASRSSSASSGCSSCSRSSHLSRQALAARSRRRIVRSARHASARSPRASSLAVVQSYVYSVGDIGTATFWICAFLLAAIAVETRRVRQAAPARPQPVLLAGARGDGAICCRSCCAALSARLRRHDRDRANRGACATIRPARPRRREDPPRPVDGVRPHAPTRPRSRTTSPTSPSPCASRC